MTKRRRTVVRPITMLLLVAALRLFVSSILPVPTCLHGNPWNRCPACPR